MALNITEANAVNQLYSWLTGRTTPAGEITPDRAHEAMATLARGAHNALSAGVNEQRVRDERDRWPTVQPREQPTGSRVDYECTATFQPDSITLKQLRADFARPARLVGCGEFVRLSARELTAGRAGRQIELRFVITATPDLGDAAKRAAELVRILCSGQTQSAPTGTVALTPLPAPGRANRQAPAETRPL